MASIEGPPTIFQVHLKPGTEIHGRRRSGYTNIAEIPGGVARRNVHAAAKTDCEVLEVAADALPFPKDIQSGFGRARELIPKGYMVMDPLHDGLDSRPSGGGVAEKANGSI